MKCKVCAEKFTNLKNKICPEDTGKGYTNDNVKFKKRTKKFSGSAATEAANNFVEKLRADKKYYSIRQSAKVNLYAKEKNEATVVYYERLLGAPGGLDGEKPDT